ncbi:glycosyl transferase family 2 [Paenibacillus sp. CAA11]|uniref:glycosyltransferase family 2 protein n=1 Tax=Paenibacillus sp. CAA11 TaxID=1532905 RepID=UPI000D388FDC|nr:glycosyltransferase family 2 protein [Paenibacillus sp. CAA11]AWB46177.1 glycosyl transferase family 2 [Paenibacillus sp. CAA11]
MDLSIIIVNFNTCDMTMDCLNSVYNSKIEFNYEVILVDNHSSDGSPEMIPKQYPQVKFIANKDNLGFAKANNQGMGIASGRYVLLLNSDTIVQPDTFQNMIRFMDNAPDVGAAGCKVILPDGSLDRACKRGNPTPSASFYYAFGFSKMFPKVPKFNQYQLGYLDPNDSYPVDCLVGAFMIVRKEVIEQVGGLDEEYFMYGEDIDWCYRIKQAGWNVYYKGDTYIVHYKGGSARRRPLKIVYEFHRAMALFHRKHYQQQYNWAINTAVYMGIAIKFTLSLITNWVKPLRPAPSQVGPKPGSSTESGTEVRL